MLQLEGEREGLAPHGVPREICVDILTMVRILGQYVQNIVGRIVQRRKCPVAAGSFRCIYLLDLLGCPLYLLQWLGEKEETLRGEARSMLNISSVETLILVVTETATISAPWVNQGSEVVE